MTKKTQWKSILAAFSFTDELSCPTPHYKTKAPLQVHSATGTVLIGLAMGTGRTESLFIAGLWRGWHSIDSNLKLLPEPASGQSLALTLALTITSKSIILSPSKVTNELLPVSGSLLAHSIVVTVFLN